MVVLTAAISGNHGGTDSTVAMVSPRFCKAQVHGTRVSRGGGGTWSYNGNKRGGKFSKPQCRNVTCTWMKVCTDMDGTRREVGKSEGGAHIVGLQRG